MLVAAALTLGGSIRVGLEDNFYLPDGEMARSNGELIAKARQLTEELGRRPATVQEARALLGITEPRDVSLPLDGLKVLDLSRLLPGGFCSLLLADFGADVIKVEDTGMGDYVRWSPPYYEGAEETARGALFLALNRGKRSIRVDLKSRAAARRCCCGWPATPTCCSSPSAPACSTGSASATSGCERVNPRLVYCAITGYGQDGPNRDRSGHDMNYLGLNGLLGLTGDAGRAAGPGRRPDRRHRRRRADGRRSGVLVALRERERSGAGPARRLLDVRRRRCRGWRWSRPRRSPRGARAAARASSSSPARSPATARTGARTATSRSARSSRSSGPRSAAASGARTCSTTPSTRPAPTRTRPSPRSSPRARASSGAQFASEHDCCLEPVLELDEVARLRARARAGDGRRARPAGRRASR